MPVGALTSMSPEEIREAVDNLLEAAAGDGVEVIVTDRDVALTRFANNEIHQNVAEGSASARVRVVANQRTGVAATTRLDPGSLRAALARARDVAQHQPAREDLPELTQPGEGPAAAAQLEPAPPPEARAEMVAAICGQAQSSAVRAFGALSSGNVRYTIANSTGLYRQTVRPIAELSVVTMADGGTGYAHRAAATLDDIDAAGAGLEAVDKALRTRAATAIEPGVYPVVLEEYAVALIIDMLAVIGFSGLAVEEGRSFMRIGERIMGDQVSIWDDGNDPTGLPMPFDFEGVPKQRVDLVRDGIATGLVHDLASARRAGVASTGHGWPAPNAGGATPTNMFMAGGNAPTREDLLSGIERGVWVTRFHYVNVVRPRDGVLTGMTRDGTFLIENGRITRPIKDMRFTQSAPEALRGTVALTKETHLVGGEDYDYEVAYRVPAVQLSEFNFSSVTS